MITLKELSRSPDAARCGRVLYEDMAFVAHLSELDRQSERLGSRKHPAGISAPLIAAGRRCAGYIKKIVRLANGSAPGSACGETVSREKTSDRAADAFFCSGANREVGGYGG